MTGSVQLDLLPVEPGGFVRFGPFRAGRQLCRRCTSPRYEVLVDPRDTSEMAMVCHACSSTITVFPPGEVRRYVVDLLRELLREAR